MSLPPEEGRDPVAIAERAFELGINYFDTAPGYGNGQSETNVATVVSSHRDQIFLATKVHFPRTALELPILPIACPAHFCRPALQPVF